MKHILFFLLLAATVPALAQTKKDSAVAKDTAAITANESTPLLTYKDILYLHDSALQNVPYKYAPIIDNIMQFLTQTIQMRANEYNQVHAKKTLAPTTKAR